MSKTVFTPGEGSLMTWYIRDAQGNTMAFTITGTAGSTGKSSSSTAAAVWWKPNINLNTVTDSSLSVWDSIGKKGYELNNHLGNVMAVVSDNRLQNGSGYEADVVSARDYSPFGMPMVGRTFSSDLYRYGFNGKENDNEVKGVGNSVDFGARIYDSSEGS